MQFSSFELIKVRYIVLKLRQRSLEHSQNYVAKQLPLLASLTLFILVIFGVIRSFAHSSQRVRSIDACQPFKQLI